MKDLIIDFETLGDYPDAVVPAVAFVAFDMKAMDTFEELKNRSVCVKLDLKHQLKHGRVINQRTVDWWKTQPEEAKWMMKPDAEKDRTLEQFCDALDAYCAEHIDKKNSFVWARGIQYDFPILADIYRKAGRELPFNYWNLMCSKVFIRTLTGDKYAKYDIEGGVPEGFIKHDPQSDVALDVMRIQELVQKFYS